MTTEALARLETLYSILAHTLKLDDRVDWETLKERTPFAGDHRFPESEPQRKTTPEPRYQEPTTGLWDVIFGQIGSASCRECVCQYVLIEVVAVSLNKKT